MGKKILFITSTSPAVNPRLSKEVQTALQEGYSPTVVYFKLGIWADAQSRTWLQDLQIPSYELDATRSAPYPWLFATIAARVLAALGKWWRLSLFAQSVIVDKRTWVLQRFLKRHKGQYQLLIAHNMGALYPAYAWARRHQIPFAFDVEDYHPGEKGIADQPLQRRYNETLLQQLLPPAAYVSYASPLIRDRVLSLFQQKLDWNRHIVIVNSFQQVEFLPPKAGVGKVKFVWFSQNIAEGRGLELFVPELYRFKDQVEVHLIGNLYSSFYDGFLHRYASILTFYPPCSQLELNRKLTEFDIGLAIESSSTDENRDICWTNKILAYAQAGLYILATDTRGQRLFMKAHPSHGIICEQNAASVYQRIDYILHEIASIRQTSATRYQTAQVLAWEKEGARLTAVWRGIIEKQTTTEPVWGSF
ncbi:MAG: hypothetical protein ACK4TA_08140 [Saprospiraceae bacterium]